MNPVIRAVLPPNERMSREPLERSISAVQISTFDDFCGLDNTIGDHMDALEKNKQIVLRFNKEVIEQGNITSFNELMDKDFVNRTAPPQANGPQGMLHIFNNVLRPAFPDLKVEIYDQVAEGDKVTTRKAILGTHSGELMGISPTGKRVTIDVIDVVRIRNGKYIEHWNITSLPSVVAELKAK